MLEVLFEFMREGIFSVGRKAGQLGHRAEGRGRASG